MHDLDDVLAGREALQDIAAHGALADTVDELLDHGEVDVGLEQGQADLAHGLGDVVLGQAALASEAVEGGAEAIRERVEHASQRSRGPNLGATNPRRSPRAVGGGPVTGRDGAGTSPRRRRIARRIRAAGRLCRSS